MYCYLHIEAKPSIFVWFHSDHNKIVMGDTTIGLIDKSYNILVSYLFTDSEDILLNLAH